MYKNKQSINYPKEIQISFLDPVVFRWKKDPLFEATSHTKHGSRSGSGHRRSPKVNLPKTAYDT